MNIVYVQSIHRKFNPSHLSSTKILNASHSFSAVKPLLLRDPFSFLRAMAVTAAFEPGSSSSDGYVALLTADQKASNTIALSKLFKTEVYSMAEQQSPSPAKKAGGRRKRLSMSSSGKGKSHKRSHTPKRSKKDKVENKERQENIHNSSVISTTHHIVSLLVEHAIATSATSIQTPVSSDSQAEKEVDRSFGLRHNSSGQEMLFRSLVI